MSGRVPTPAIMSMVDMLANPRLAHEAADRNGSCQVVDQHGRVLLTIHSHKSEEPPPDHPMQVLRDFTDAVNSALLICSVPRHAVFAIRNAVERAEERLGVISGPTELASNRSSITHADHQMHVLWTKAVGTADYNKREWAELERRIWALLIEPKGGAS